MENIEEEIKQELRKIDQGLNPFDLKRNINRIQDKLFRMTYLRKKESILISIPKSAIKKMNFF